MTVAQIKLLTQKQLASIAMEHGLRSPQKLLLPMHLYHRSIVRPGVPLRDDVGYMPRNISGLEPIYTLMGLSLSTFRPVQLKQIEEKYLIQVFEPFGGRPLEQNRYGGTLHLRYEVSHGWLFQAVCCMTFRGIYTPE